MPTAATTSESTTTATGSTSSSILQRRHDDCLPCRLVSGCGFLGMGAYIASQAKHRPAGPGRLAIYAVATAALGVGVSRLLGTYPFNINK